MEALSYTYGWTPTQILNEDSEALDVYLAILSARGKKQEATMSKQDRKQWR